MAKGTLFFTEKSLSIIHETHFILGPTERGLISVNHECGVFRAAATGSVPEGERQVHSSRRRSVACEWVSGNSYEENGEWQQRELEALYIMHTCVQSCPSMM